MDEPRVTLDVELTNRCNATCSFCPREETPHQGVMSEATFARTLERALEYRTHVERAGAQLAISLCGLGEPLLHPGVVDAVARARGAGFRCLMGSNGARLSEDLSRRLLDAGLSEISINVGETGEDYRDVYGLPFERTRANVVRFAELAEGRCRVNIVLVDHREDGEHRDRMTAFWTDQGFENLFHLPLMNRAGALDVARMTYDDADELERVRSAVSPTVDGLICRAPFVFVFVGYDGNYYLCAADWRKEVSFGSVHDRSLFDLLGPKLEAVRTREPICRSCSIDPTNTIVDGFRALDAGRIEAQDFQSLVAMAVAGSVAAGELVERLEPGRTAAAPRRRRIPVRAVGSPT